MKGALKVMDGSGHTTYPFDTEVEEDVEKVVAEFNETMARYGSSAKAYDTSVTPGEPIEDYVPGEMTDVTIVPAFAAG